MNSDFFNSSSHTLSYLKNESKTVYVVKHGIVLYKQKSVMITCFFTPILEVLTKRLIEKLKPVILLCLF